MTPELTLKKLFFAVKFNIVMSIHKGVLLDFFLLFILAVFCSLFSFLYRLLFYDILFIIFFYLLLSILFCFPLLLFYYYCFFLFFFWINVFLSSFFFFFELAPTQSDVHFVLYFELTSFLSCFLLAGVHLRLFLGR